MSLAATRVSKVASGIFIALILEVSVGVLKVSMFVPTVSLSVFSAVPLLPLAPEAPTCEPYVLIIPIPEKS